MFDSRNRCVVGIDSVLEASFIAQGNTFITNKILHTSLLWNTALTFNREDQFDRSLLLNTPSGSWSMFNWYLFLLVSCEMILCNLAHLLRKKVSSWGAVIHWGRASNAINNLMYSARSVPAIIVETRTWSHPCFTFCLTFSISQFGIWPFLSKECCFGACFFIYSLFFLQIST